MRRFADYGSRVVNQPVHSQLALTLCGSNLLPVAQPDRSGCAAVRLKVAHCCGAGKGKSDRLKLLSVRRSVKAHVSPDFNSQLTFIENE